MKKGFLNAYLLDGNGGGKALSWIDVENWSSEQGLLWVHLDYTCKKAQQWIRKKSGIERHVAESMLYDEIRPRALVTDDYLAVFLRGVNMNPGQDPEDMVSIRIWLSRNCIITTRKRTLLSIQDVQEAIERGEGPKTATEFLAMLNSRISDRIADVLEQIDDQVDKLEEEVVAEESRLLRPQLADIRRQTISIKRYLSPQREALSSLVHAKTALLSEDDRVHFREATERLIRYVEDLDAKRERAAITQEELSSRIAEQLDARMYALSVVAIIFLPMTFVTGLLGINVGGIPGSDNGWGFVIVTVLLTLLGVLTFFLIRRYKWM